MHVQRSLNAMNIAPILSPPPSNSPDISLSRRHHLFDTHMLVVIICLAISFLIIASITFCIRRYIEVDDLLDAISSFGSTRRSRPSTVRGLSTIILDTFQVFVYSDVKALKHGKVALECAVCLSEFVDNESLRLLPECNHVFHRDCIDSWLACRITCPVCRACLIQKPGKLSEFNSSTHLVDNELTQSPLPQEIDINLPAIDTQHIKNSEKYTLRLPKEVRDELVRLGSSKNVIGISFPTERSLVKGRRSESCRIGNGKYSPFGYGLLEREVKSERWMFASPPPCFSGGGGSARWPERRRKSLGFVTSPFDRLLKVAEKDDNANPRLPAESPV